MAIINEADRRDAIYASEAHCVLGLDRYTSPADVWARKTGMLLPAKDESADDTLLRRMGNYLESFICDEFSSRNGLQIVEATSIKDEFDGVVLGATPDRYIVDEDQCRVAVLEVKMVRSHRAKYWGHSGDLIPDYVRIQVEVQLAVTGMQMAYVAAIVDGEYRQFRIEPDLELREMIIGRLRKWWQDYVIPKRMPEPDGSEAYAKLLAGLHPKSNGTRLPATADATHWAKELLETKRQVDRIMRLKEEQEQRLKAMLGDADMIEGICAWSNVNGRSHVAWKDMAEESMLVTNELISRFTRRGDGQRRFRLLAKEGEL